MVGGWVGGWELFALQGRLRADWETMLNATKVWGSGRGERPRDNDNKVGGEVGEDGEGSDGAGSVAVLLL